MLNCAAFVPKISCVSYTMKKPYSTDPNADTSITYQRACTKIPTNIMPINADAKMKSKLPCSVISLSVVNAYTVRPSVITSVRIAADKITRV